MSGFDKAVSIDDLRALARRRLPKAIFDFVDGGAGDEASLRANYLRFDAYALLGRALQDVSVRDQSIVLFGRRNPSPVIVAPTGASGLLWPEGEAEVARACASAGTIMMVSAGATLSIEEVARAAAGPKWLQLFIYRDRGLTRDFVARARSAGYEALCLTVDCPVVGSRERDTRNGLSVNPRITARNIIDTALHLGWWLRMRGCRGISFRNFESHGGRHFLDMANYTSSLLDPSVDWKDLEWLRSIWSGPLVIKGIMRGSDAAPCSSDRLRCHSGLKPRRSPTGSHGRDDRRSERSYRWRRGSDSGAVGWRHSPGNGRAESDRTRSHRRRHWPRASVGACVCGQARRGEIAHAFCARRSIWPWRSAVGVA